MPLLAIGVSHHDVESEQLATLASQADAIVSNLRERHPGVSGVIALATCNRVEFYLDSAGFHAGVEATVAQIRAHAPHVPDHVLDSVRVYADDNAVSHLFGVACGLDSMVVGEAEIAGQVRAALTGRPATTSPRLVRLFQEALSTSKAVATQTSLGAAGRSVASVAIDLVESRSGPVAGRRALLLGSGAYAGVALATLRRRGCTEVSVYSHSGRGLVFAERHDAVAVSSEALPDVLRHTDLVVSVSGTGEATLTVDLIDRARGTATPAAPAAPAASDSSAAPTPLQVVDLSARGDIPDDVAAHPGVHLLTLDGIGAHAPTEQVGAVLAARAIVDAAVAAYLHVERGRTAAPAVTAMRAHVMQIIEAEVAASRRRYDEATADAIARSLHRVTGSLLHTPSVRAVELARTGDLADYQRAMHTLFGIDL
ncbi:MAG: glutamyl-tRNA reductase [Dermatophilaceae bacterium]